MALDFEWQLTRTFEVHFVQTAILHSNLVIIIFLTEMNKKCLTKHFFYLPRMLVIFNVLPAIFVLCMRMIFLTLLINLGNVFKRLSVNLGVICTNDHLCFTIFFAAPYVNTLQFQTWKLKNFFDFVFHENFAILFWFHELFSSSPFWNRKTNLTTKFKCLHVSANITFLPIWGKHSF